MVQEIVKTIESKVILSDDGLYRYSLMRTWDKNKKKAAVIMLNPSKANVLKSDKTVMNVTNFLIDHDYGSLTIVNLFSYIATDSKKLTERNLDNEAPNDDYIRDVCSKADVIIVAWTKDRKHVTRKREVEIILKEHEYKLKCFIDGAGNKPRHPRDLGENWSLGNYVFKYI